jgi:glycosyltransferase involved in cell wall biosynthesis
VSAHLEKSSYPLVSVVTPVYNGAEYLAECIESVLAQTYPNWDYTIINNKSTDESSEIARRYSAKESRIRVVENEHFLRAIPNHNVALRQASATSKYCKVIFADDWMFPDCISEMVAAAEENPSAGIVHSYSLQGNKVAWVGLPYPSRLVPGRDLCRQFFVNDLYVFGSASSMLYRSDILRSHDPFYNEANLHADTEACLAVLREYDFSFVHQVLTFSRERDGSLSQMSTDRNTHVAAMLYHVVKYGPDCLTPEELELAIERHLAKYYKFLGKSLLLGRDSEFWQYHKLKLKEAGFAFSRTRVGLASLGKLAEVVLNPQASIQKWRGPKRPANAANARRSSGDQPAAGRAKGAY